MSKRTRRPSAPLADAQAASRARDRRLGAVIDGEVPVAAEEWALMETVAALRGEAWDEAPPPGLVAQVLAMAEDADPPHRRGSPGALVSWARRRLHRRRGTHRVGFIARRHARRGTSAGPPTERRRP